MQGAGLLHLLTEPTKSAILAAIGAQSATVSEIVERTGGEQSNISHHLRTLRQAGVVRSQAEGRIRHYRLADPAVAAALEELEAVGARLQRTTFYTRLSLPVDTRFHGYG